MTDNEIIKALECCTSDRCLECPIKNIPKVSGCMALMTNALKLINRQKAEIRKYKNCYEQVKWERDLFEEQCKTAKVEARKDFDERLKKLYETYPEDEEASALYLINKINEIVKEMKR